MLKFARICPILNDLFANVFIRGRFNKSHVRKIRLLRHFFQFRFVMLLKTITTTENGNYCGKKVTEIAIFQKFSFLNG